MPEYQSMSGRYYQTCADDVRRSPGWFKNILLLGLVNIVPVFGQMTVLGYAFEWGHKAAWGVSSPMPEKIYGRPRSKMLRWGWFALVITFVFALVPYLISLLGDVISGASIVPSLYDAYSHSYHPLSGATSVAGGAIGVLLQVVSWVAAILLEMLAWVAIIRMTVYDRLGTGFQLKKIWKMATHDFGGLFRIFGMELLVGLIIVIVGMILAGVLATMFGMGAMVTFIGATEFQGYGSDIGFPALLMMLLMALPLLLVIGYALSCMGVYLQILVGRAAGYWCRQFEVDKWGTKDDPLPFEHEEAADNGEPQRPQGETPEAAQQRPEAEPEHRSTSEEPPRSSGPVGWRAAGTSAASRDDGDHFAS